MLEVKVNVEVPRRYHYTKQELAALLPMLKEHGEKRLLAEDAASAREEAAAANGRVLELQAQIKIEREQMQTALNNGHALRDELVKLRDAADDKAADYLKLCDERAARISELVKERDGWKAQAIEAIGDSLKSIAKVSAAHNIANLAVNKCEELHANLEMFKAIALHNKHVGLQLMRERDEARELAAHFFQESIGYMFAAKLASEKRNRAIQECARLEFEKCLVEIQRDQARELACKAIESFGVPAVMIVPFAGEQVATFGEPDDIGDEDEHDPDCLDCDRFIDEHRERGNDGEPDEDADEVPADDNAMQDRALHFDKGKLSFNNVPDEGERELARVFSYGETKYGYRNWEKAPGLTALQYYGSMRRHLMEWRAGVDNDPESTLSHLAHVAANALMCLVTLRRFPQSDNRKAAQ